MVKNYYKSLINLFITMIYYCKTELMSVKYGGG